MYMITRVINGVWLETDGPYTSGSLHNYNNNPTDNTLQIKVYNSNISIYNPQNNVPFILCVTYDTSTASAMLMEQMFTQLVI